MDYSILGGNDSGSALKLSLDEEGYIGIFWNFCRRSSPSSLRSLALLLIIALFGGLAWGLMRLKEKDAIYAGWGLILSRIFRVDKAEQHKQLQAFSSVEENATLPR
jgi:hypothetical protein